MDATSKITEKLKMVIDEYKDNELLFISAKDIPEVLSIVSDVFQFKFGTKLHETVSLFIQQYPQVSIHKHIFLEFLNDLLEIDLVEKIATENPQWLNVGEPQPTINVNNDTKIQENLKTLNEHFHERISKLNETEVIVPRTKTTQLSLYTNNYIFLINLLLISTLFILTIHQKFDLSPILFNFCKKLLIYETSKDLYWWQKVRFTNWNVEAQIWKLIDFMKNREEQLLAE